MAQDRFKASTRRGMWILAACGAACGLAACGGSDPANDAVQQAALTINTLSLGGANPTPDIELRLAAYRKIVSDLQPHTSASTPATASVASILVARAHMGLGSYEADAVAAAELQARDLLRAVRLQFDRYVAEQAQAASADAYDPAPYLADLDRQIQEKDAEIAAAWANKSALDKALAELEEKAAAASSLASQQRQLETRLRQRAINASAVEQADLIGRANEHKRAADARDKEASLLRAQAAQRAPEGIALQAEIDRLTAQRKLLDEAKAEIRAFAKASDDRAAASRAAAMEAAAQVSRLVGDLAKLRAGIPERAERAAEAFDRAAQAASAAGRVGGESATTAMLAEAQAKHAKADLMFTRARGLHAYASLLQAMADATPPLPDSAAFASQAGAAKAEADKLAAEARELLAEVQETYAGAGGRGDVADRLQRLAASMEELTGVARGDADAGIMSQDQALEDVALDDAAGDPEAEVRAMLREFVAATESGDVSAPKRYVDLSDPGIRALVDASIELDAACRERFGKSLSDVAGEFTGGQSMSGMTVINSEMLDQVTLIVESPDRVRIESPTGLPPGMSVAAVKIDGHWKYQMEYPPQVSKVLQDMAHVFSTVAQEVRSGAISTVEEMLISLGRHMMQMQGGG